MEAANASDEVAVFEHEPLDHTQPSIRLITIKFGLSAEGYVECDISHTAIESSYTCLSYRWGELDPSTSKIILLNGKIFSVRQNLFDFLYMACTQHDFALGTPAMYWIDALCIDQSNTLERNHQVAQMGDIYAGAQRVHVWLGATANPERMKELLSGLSGNLSQYYSGRDPWLVGEAIIYNQYWRRAWVVQEFCLAQEVVVSLDAQTYTFPDFSRRVHLLDVDDEGPLDVEGTPFEQFNVPIRNQTLLFLLHQFRDKLCVIPRDRIFSLLSICHEDERIPVDYDMHWTKLAAHTFTNARDKLCACSAALIARSLDSSVRLLDRDQRACTAVLAFELTDVVIGHHGFLRLLDTQSFQENDCTMHLLGALRRLLHVTSLPRHLKRQQLIYCGVFNFSAALRKFVNSKENKERWEHCPGGSYRMCSFKAGWSIGVCDELVNTCSVRISLSTLQTAFLGKTLCVFSRSRSTRGYSPITNFRIEHVSVDGEGFMPGARFG